MGGEAGARNYAAVEHRAVPSSAARFRGEIGMVRAVPDDHRPRGA
jgi:hypothetical protein